jgi:hypothetical protein
MIEYETDIAPDPTTVYGRPYSALMKIFIGEPAETIPPIEQLVVPCNISRKVDV